MSFVFQQKNSSQRITENLNYKLFGNVLTQLFKIMLLILILQPQETIIYSLHNLGNMHMKNSVHFELLKYGVLQLMNFQL